MTKQDHSNRDTEYDPNKLPAEITRELFITFGTGKWNEGRIQAWDLDVTNGETVSDYLLIGRQVVKIALSNNQDLKGKLIKSLQAEQEEIKAEFHMRLKANQEKIDNLLAIEYQPGKASTTGVL